MFCCLKQLCHQLLRQPNSIIFKPYFNSNQLIHYSHCDGNLSHKLISLIRNVPKGVVKAVAESMNIEKVNTPERPDIIGTLGVAIIAFERII